MQAYMEQRRAVAPGSDLWVGVTMRATAEAPRFGFAGHIEGGRPCITGVARYREGRAYLMIGAYKLIDEDSREVHAEMRATWRNLTAMGLTPEEVRWTKTVGGEMVWQPGDRFPVNHYVAIRLPDNFQPANGAGAELVMDGGYVPRDGAE